MVVYFNLRGPDSEQLLGDDESYGNRESRPCPITNEHVDFSRRIGPMRVKLKHNRRDEQMIWCWVFGTVIHEALLAEFKNKGSRDTVPSRRPFLFATAPCPQSTESSSLLAGQVLHLRNPVCE
jgi:hypothetical protein